MSVGGLLLDNGLALLHAPVEWDTPYYLTIGIVVVVPAPLIKGLI